MPKIIHYREKCIGCNSCVEHDPSRWIIMTEDGKAMLKRAKKKKEVYIVEITTLEVEKSKEAARDCPMQIIHVV